MTKVNIGSFTSYTIPLDSLDLAYLGKYVHFQRDEKMPLWTKKRLDGESEYCQVQIVTRDNNNEDCYSEASDTYQCHICNMNVPKLCYQKHNESEQHETIKKIYQKVLERVSKQINVNSMNIDEDIGNDSYYCEPCSKIIKIENKNNHEATEYHAKSVKDLIIINEFYKTFNKNLSNNVNDELLGDESDPFNPNDNYDVYDNNMEASSSVDSDDDIFDPDTNLPPAPGHSIIETMIQSPKEEKKQSFEEYLKEMIKKYNLNVALPVVDGEFITIVTPNGNKVKVSREHFQGYREIIKRMYCQLCNMWILENTTPHDVTEKHIQNIFRPINDKFARSVNNVWSHCVPCNELVLKDSDLHTHNDVHKKIIKDTQTPKTDKTLCEDCNLYIDTHNFSVHLDSTKHIKTLMKQNSIQDTGNNTIYCKICNLTVLRCTLKFHIGTELHLARKTNDSNVLSNKRNDTTEIKNENNKDNADTEINNKTLAKVVKITGAEFCDLCKVSIPAGGMKMHVDGRSHQKKVAQLSSANKNDVKTNENKVEIGVKPSTSANNGSSASTNRLYDGVASTSTMSSLSNYSNETDDEDAKIDGYYEMTEFVDETRTNVRCKICSVNIVFVERNIIEHMEGKNHTEKANKQKLEVYYRLMFYADDEKTKLKCQICDCHIPHVERNIIEHMEGRNHENAENELLKFHLIARESSEFICECCSIRTTDYIEHMNSRNHTLKFLETYEIDRAEMRKYVYEDNSNNAVARRHRVRYRNLLKHNGIFKLDDVNHYCGVCQIKLSRISEIDHVLGERHMSQLEQVNKLSTLLEQLELTDVIRT